MIGKEEKEAEESTLSPLNSEERLESEKPLELPEQKSKRKEEKKGDPELLRVLEEVSLPEEKLAKAVELMELSLAQKGEPDFKTFWAAKNFCFELFKEGIPPAARAQLFVKYRELGKEAKRLRGIFEERAAYAAEQIEMAVAALEKDLEEFATLLANASLPELPRGLRTLSGRYDLYLEKQQELALLHALAARINALRKELLKTGMRIRQKNALFERLSLAGDRVFPRKKELTKEISQLFLEDVEQFAGPFLAGKAKEKGLQPLREEIMGLQSALKAISLNAVTFAKARERLGECWDKLKLLDRERKKEFLQLKQAFKESADEVRAKIAAFSEQVASQSLSTAEAERGSGEILDLMRAKQLHRDDVRQLKDALSEALAPVKERAKQEEAKKRALQREKEEERKSKIQELEARIRTLGEVDASLLAEEIATLSQEIRALHLTRFEKGSLEGLLTPFKDAMLQREHQRVLALSDQDPEKKKELKEAIASLLAQKQEVEGRVEHYRKLCGSSGLDFEQSLHFNEQLNIEKARRERLSEELFKLEAMMDEIS